MAHKEAIMGAFMRDQVVNCTKAIVADVADKVAEKVESSDLSVQALGEIIQNVVNAGDWREMTSKKVNERITYEYILGNTDNDCNLTIITGNVGAIIAAEHGAAAKLTYDAVRAKFLQTGNAKAFSKSAFRAAIIPTIRTSVAKICNVMQGMLSRQDVSESDVLASVAKNEKEFTDTIVDMFWKVARKLAKGVVDGDSSAVDKDTA